MSKHHSFWQEEGNKPTPERTSNGSPGKMGIEAEKLAEIRRIRQDLAAEAKEQEALKKIRSGRLMRMLQKVRGGHKAAKRPLENAQSAAPIQNRDLNAQWAQQQLAFSAAEPEQTISCPTEWNRETPGVRGDIPSGKKIGAGRQTPKGETRRRMLAFAALCCFLAALAFGGTQFMLFQQKRAISAQVTAKLAEIESKNEAALALLDQKVQNFAEELQSITEALKEAGATIDSSGAANREAMAQRIEALDKQLKSLEASLKILEADKNGRQ